MQQLDIEKLRATVSELHHIQFKLNFKYLGDDWIAKASRHKEVNYPVAILDEAAELIRSDTSWKFWTKTVTEANCRNERIEYIDILHFLLSESMIQGVDRSIKVCTDALMHPLALDFVLNTSNVRDVNAARKDLIELLGYCTNAELPAWVSFFSLGKNLGLNFVDVCSFYKAKAVLNAFRIANGYKEGTYKKEWSPGREDNDLLTDFVVTQTKFKGDVLTEGEIQDFLATTYAKVL